MPTLIFSNPRSECPGNSVMFVTHALYLLSDLYNLVPNNALTYPSPRMP